MATAPLPFPSLIVASNHDPYAAPSYSRRCASAWGRGLVELDRLGHLNAASRLGEWPGGAQLLAAFDAGIGRAPALPACALPVRRGRDASPHMRSLLPMAEFDSGARYADRPRPPTRSPATAWPRDRRRSGGQGRPVRQARPGAGQGRERAGAGADGAGRRHRQAVLRPQARRRHRALRRARGGWAIAATPAKVAVRSRTQSRSRMPPQAAGRTEERPPHIAGTHARRAAYRR